MDIIKGKDNIINPLQRSTLSKKGLCDYVVNVASGCLHGCTFCYVPATPAIRTQQQQLKEKGVNDPQLDWGKYLFTRQDIPVKIENILARKKVWLQTKSGRGIVLLCSGTDPYQNRETAVISTQTVRVLLKYNRRVRILTRSPLWTKDLDTLVNPDVIVGMSLPTLDDDLSRKIEPNAPLPSLRYKALQSGYQAGCRLYVAMAPTHPQMNVEDFKRHLDKVMALNPEVIFWEPINARGSNGVRMKRAGLDFASSIMTHKTWAEGFLRQWEAIETAAAYVGCLERLHIWVDPGLRGFVDGSRLDTWFDKPTVENWLGDSGYEYGIKLKHR